MIRADWIRSPRPAELPRELPAVLAAFVALLLTAQALAQDSFFESEPNNIPNDANPVTGELVIAGVMNGGDQDGFLWTVSDNDARKRWTLELQGIPGRLAIAEIVKVTYAENGVDVTGTDRLMKMGTRDGLAPSIARDLMFEPGQYLIGIAYAGGGAGSASGEPRGALGLSVPGLSFGADGNPDAGEDAAAVATDPKRGAYRFIIREGSRLSVTSGAKAADSRETSRSVRLGREFATFESRNDAWYAFTFGEKDAAMRWDIPIQVPVGRTVAAILYDGSGTTLASKRSNDRGRLVFPDLASEAATYYVALSTQAPGFLHAIAIESVGERVAGEEAEPNGKWELANRIDLSQPLTGRIGEDNEWDYFQFDLDDATPDRLLNLRIESEPTDQALELCLLDHAWRPSPTTPSSTRAACPRTTGSKVASAMTRPISSVSW